MQRWKEAMERAHQEGEMGIKEEYDCINSALSELENIDGNTNPQMFQIIRDSVNKIKIENTRLRKALEEIRAEVEYDRQYAPGKQIHKIATEALKD